MSALTAHSSSPPVAQHAGSALFSLAGVEHAAQGIINAGGVPLLLSALQQHAATEEIVVASCAPLMRLAERDPAAVGSAMSASGITALKDALTSHLGSPSVVRSVCFTLAHVARQPAAGVLIASSGCIPPLVAALEAHVAGEDTAVAAAAEALQSIAASPGHEAAIAAAGGVQAAVAALAAHGASDFASTMLCGLLNNLAQDDSGETWPAMIAAGCIPAVITALTTLPDVVTCCAVCSAPWPKFLAMRSRWQQQAVLHLLLLHCHSMMMRQKLSAALVSCFGCWLQLSLPMSRPLLRQVPFRG